MYVCKCTYGNKTKNVCVCMCVCMHDWLFCSSDRRAVASLLKHLRLCVELSNLYVLVHMYVCMCMYENMYEGMYESMYVCIGPEADVPVSESQELSSVLAEHAKCYRMSHCK